MTARKTSRPSPSLEAQAIRLLARREYGRAELAARLRARGAEPQAIERALDKLTAQGYLSDRRYADALVTARRGQFSRRAIAHELKTRGVAADASRAALDMLAGSDDAAEAAALWARRYGTVPRDEREKARQVRFLVSRGYSLSIALRVLRAAGARVDDDTT
ncbi:MAG TPA: regulatory protein RecX [Casimicrobiaceae bacterium]